MSNNLFNKLFTVDTRLPQTQSVSISPDDTSARAVYGKIYNTYKTDPYKAQQMMDAYKTLQVTPTSKYYNPYAKHTNAAVDTLASYGIDTSKIDDNFYRQNDYLRQYLKYNGQTNTPSSPGTKASDAEKAAYAFYQVWNSEAATKKAEQQWADLQKELSYWAQRKDRNYSDDYIINNKIDWSKYGELTSMDNNKLMKPNEYNRTIGYSKDAMYGVLWAARNGGSSGSMESDIANSILSNNYTYNQNIANMLDPTNAAYQPYATGATNVDDAAMHFGVLYFPADWAKTHSYILNSGNEDDIKMYRKVQAAEANTSAAEKAAAALNQWIDKTFANETDPNKAKQKLDKLLKSGKIVVRTDNGREEIDLGVLNKMDQSMGIDGEPGTIDLLPMTRGVDYKYANALKRAQDMCAHNAANPVGDGGKYIDYTSQAWYGKDQPSVSAAIRMAQDEKLREAGEDYDLDATTAEREYLETSWSSSYDDVKGHAGEAQAWANSDEANKRKLIDSSTADVQKSYAENVLGNYQTVYNYETQKATRDYLQEELDRIAPEVEALIPGTQSEAKHTDTITVDGEDYKVTLAYNHDIGYYLESATDKSGKSVIGDVFIDPEVNELVNRYNFEAQQYEDTSIDEYKLTKEEEEKLTTYKDLQLRIQDCDKYIGENQTAYENGQKAIADAQQKFLEHEYLMEQNGLDTTALYVEDVVFSYLVGFADYDATEWSKFNPSDTFRQALASGTDRNLVYSEAENGHKELVQELEDAKAAKQYIEELGANIPSNYKTNLDRHIAKLERDIKDYEYFFLSKEKDFDDVAEKAKKEEYDNRPILRTPFKHIAEYDWDYDEYYKQLDNFDGNYESIWAGYGLRGVAGPYTKFLTEDEKNTYYYLVGKGEKAKAVDYISSLIDMSYGVAQTRMAEEIRENSENAFRTKQTSNFKTKEEADKWIEENGDKKYDMTNDENGYHISWTEDNGFGSFLGQNALAVLSAPVSSIMSLGYSAYSLFSGKELNPNNIMLAFNNFRSATREESAQSIADYYGEGTLKQKAAQMFYEMISNRLDSLMQGATFGGGEIFSGSGRFVQALNEIGGASSMGITAAMDAMMQAKRKGATDGQMIGIGLTTFAAETATEAIEIGDIKSAFSKGVNKEALRVFFKDWFTKAGLSELIGESINDIVENSADRFIMGDKSEHSDLVWKYRLEGYTPEQAEWKAFEEEAVGVMRTAFMSYFSPGMDIISYGAGRATGYFNTVGSRHKQNTNQRISEIVKDIHKENKEAKAASRKATEEHEKYLEDDLANGEGVLNLDAKNPEQAEASLIEETAQKTDIERSNKDSLSTDYQVLESAEKADRPTQTATISATLDIDGTEESADMANAAAAKLGRVFGKLNEGPFIEWLRYRSATKDYSNALSFVKRIFLGASVDNIDSKSVKQGIIYAALGGNDSASYQMIQSEAFKNATPNQQAQMLATTGYIDAKNEAIAETVNKNIYENRVAEAMKAVTLEEEDNRIQGLKDAVRKAELEVWNQQHGVKMRQQILESASNRFADATKAYTEKPTAANKKQRDAARQALRAADEAAKNDTGLKEAQDRLEKAQADLRKAQQDRITNARQRAMELVNQADAQRKEAAFKQQEEMIKAQAAAEEQSRVQDEIAKKAKELNNFTRLNAEEFVDQNFPGLSPEDRAKAIRFTMTAQQVLSRQFDSIEARQQFLDKFPKKFGLKFREVDGGEIFGANARIDPSTKTLLVNKNATQWDIMYAVLGHEITHLAEDSKTYYDLADMALQIRYGAGVTWADTLAKVKAGDTTSRIGQDYLRMKKLYDESKATTSNNHTAEEILQEIVADSVGQVIAGDEKAIRQLAEKPSLARRVIEAIKSFIRKARGLEGEPLSQAQRVVEMLESAVKEAESKQQTKNSLSVITDENGEEIATELPGGTVALDTTKYSLNSFNEEEQQRVRQALLNKIDPETGEKQFTEEEVDQYLTDALGIAKYIADNKARLNFVANSHQKFLKDNEDYYYTLDASTLCAKRLLYQGTFNAVQHMMPDTAFMPEDLIDLVNIMREMGYETPCGICYVESRRRWLDKYAKEWLEKYDGKYKPTIDEVTTSDGLEDLRQRELHKKVEGTPYTDFVSAMAHKGSNNPKVVQLRTEYNGDIVKELTPEKIQKVKDIGGLRIQSFSDFETPHLLDMVQAVYDMASVGLTSQAYTKVPNFAWVFGDTGIKINLSLIGKGTGLDENGNLLFDNVEGMNFDEAMKLRERYGKNVGTILVGMNEAHIIAAMGDHRIDYIIPFHKSGWSQEEIRKVGTLNNYDDFTDYQNERIIVGRETVTKEFTAKDLEKDPNAVNDWIRIRRGEGKTSFSTREENGVTIVTADGYATKSFDTELKELKDAYRAEHNVDKVPQGAVTGRSNFTPVGANFYWNFNLSGEQNAINYLEMCAKDGRIPKFWNFLVDNGDGSFSLPQGKDARSTAIREGYWKTLVDFKMYENDGYGRNGGEVKGAPQMEVTPDINMSEAYRVMNEYKLGRQMPDKPNGEKGEFIPMKDNNSLPVAMPAAELFVEHMREKQARRAEADRIEQENRAKGIKGPKMTKAQRKLMAEAENLQMLNNRLREKGYAGNLTIEGVNELMKETDPNKPVKYSLPGEGEQNAINILDGVDTETGELVDFINLMFDKDENGNYLKNGETRKNNASLPKNQWIGVAKNGMVYGRVKFGKQYEITNTSPEYEDAKIKGTNYDIGDGETTLYYPILEREDFRDNPKEAEPRGFYKRYRYSLPSDYEYLSAVNHGERDYALQLLDEAAYNAGYTTGAYHGSNITDIDVFNTHTENDKKTGWQLLFGTHFTQNPEYAKIYAKKAKGSKGTSRLTTKEGRVYDVKLNLGKSLDLRTAHNYTSGEEIFDLYNDLPDNIKKKVPMHSYTEAEIEMGYEPGDYVNTGDMERALQAMNPKQAEEFLRDHGYNSVLYYANYGGGMVNNMYAKDPSIIMLDPERIKEFDITYDDQGNVIPISERFDMNKPSIRYSLPSDDVLMKTIQQWLSSNESPVKNDAYAEGLEGENPQMTKANGPAQRQFGSETLQRSNQIDEDTKRIIAANSAYYPDTNAEQIERAIKWIRFNKQSADSDGFYESVNAVTSKNFNYMSADGQARMIAVMAMAAATNNTVAQTMIADAYNRQGTDIGRALQARKLFRLMTPDGRIAAIDSMMQKTKDEFAAKGKKIDLDFSHWVYEMAAAAESEDEFRRVQKMAAQEIANQLPANWKDRVRSLRMLAMLGNPRTHVRNIMGNFVFLPVVGAKNKIAAIMELSKPQGERTKTTSLFLDKDIKAFAKEDALKMKDVLTGEAKYNENNLVSQQQKAFHGLLQAVMDFNSGMLEKEDWWFLKPHYTRALGGWMQANGYTVDQVKSNPALLEQGRNYAVLEAQKATYRDFNELAKRLNDFVRNPKTVWGKAGAFAVEATLPFKKTPINILRRGVEYSPLGLMKAITSDIYHLNEYKKFMKGELDVMPDNAITPNQFIDDIASGLTGTGIMAMGFLLSSLGILTCGKVDDDDPEKEQGVQKYAIKILGTDFTYTIDWAAPVCIPLFVGAAIQEEHDDMSWAEFADSVSTIAEPVFNLSMLDGLSSVFKTSKYDDTDTLTQIGVKIGTNYVSSYWPSLFGAIARTVDGTRRKSYVPSDQSNGPMGTVKYAWESLKNKIPGASQTSIPMRDIWGEEETSSLAERVFENFISPGYIQNYKNDPILNEMSRLHDNHVEGSNNIVPGNPPKSYTYQNNKYVFSDKEYDELFSTRGQVAHDLLTQLMNSSDYKNADDAAKVEMINSVWSYAKKVGLSKVVPNYDYDQQTASSIAEAGKINSYKANMLKAMESNDWDGFDTMVEALYQEGADDSDIKGWIRTKYMNAYKSAYKRGDNAEMARIETILDNSGFVFDVIKWEEQVDEKYGY